MTGDRIMYLTHEILCGMILWWIVGLWGAGRGQGDVTFLLYSLTSRIFRVISLLFPHWTVISVVHYPIITTCQTNYCSPNVLCFLFITASRPYTFLYSFLLLLLIFIFVLFVVTPRLKVITNYGEFVFI